jgi:mono/diheme cytochrome c family protein
MYMINKIFGFLLNRVVRGSKPAIARLLALALSSVFAHGALAAQAADKALIERGRYLVEHVGMCADCHTPRDAHGELLKSESLQGAPLGVTPVHPVPGWPSAAPRIAGLPQGYSTQSLAVFLRTGQTVSGVAARPPMPAYRMSDSDAHAVAAYLASLQ